MAKSTSKNVIGIDLGGTNMQIGIVSASNRVLGRSKKKTRSNEGLKAIIDRMVDGVNEALDDAGVTIKSVGALGIGAAGAIEPLHGVVLQAPNLRWHDVPLAAILKKRLGVPIVVDNDVNAAVYGEHQLGAGRGVDDFLGIWLGTGVGGGLILNGSLYRGHFFTAGEIGHAILLPFATPGSVSVEDNLSRTAVVDRILRVARKQKSIVPALADNNLTEVRAKTVALAYQKGDKVTREVVDNAAELLGMVCASAATILSLPRIVLGGGLTEAMGDMLVKPVREATRRYVFPDVLKRIEVVATKLEADAGLLGAAMLARHRHIAPPAKKARAGKR